MLGFMDTAAFERHILDHLDEALTNGQIRVYYQPVIRIITRRMCGMEALARWEDPELGLLYPGSFIPVLEKHRRIHELDSFVIRSVCACYRNTMRQFGVLVPMSINLSRLDYELCDIFSVVEDAAREYRVPREALCIEITESVLNSNETLMFQYFQRFHNAGYQMWMDDFGSGYSSLNVLKDYQFDELKIDMRFLSDFHQRSRKILASIIHMAKDISIQTLVEGVETEEQFQFLRDIGCEKAQGYLFSRPLPFGECIEHIRANHIGIEPPVERNYYDEMGRVNVLSATPFVSQPVQLNLLSGKELNSIPLAIVEIREERVHLMYYNKAFYDTASDLDWKSLYGVNSLREVEEDWLKLSQLSVHIVQMLEETRACGSGKMFFVDHDEYYEMSAMRVSRHKNLCCVLLRMDNLSRGSELVRQKQLDAGLRQLYTIYSRVSVLNLRENQATPLYVDSRETLPERQDLNTLLQNYADQVVFWMDQERFLSFADPDTIEERVRASGHSYLSGFFRIRIHHGNFVWQVFILLEVEEGVYFLLSRDADAELRDFLNYSGLEGKQSLANQEGYSAELLWRNVTQNTNLKLFWKDHNRRFLGASQSFLDFYGFRSLSDIVGKTDEDMGWHLHPDLYRDNELDVVENGLSSFNSLGTCIIKGENRTITASKMPLYDDFGKIVGLFGYFFQVGEGPLARNERDKASRIDALTGLLNARGLSDELYAYRDEYDLRQTKFGRIDVYVDDFMQINSQYGFAFGDELIRTLAKNLLECCGSVASIGRMKGCHFVILCQYLEPQDLNVLDERIRSISARMQQVGGIPFTMFLSTVISADEYCNQGEES